ncbi:MAG TPA: DUF4089 domain-containing protein [Candidatus Bathyarchaeia archaeon]|nr:DUF4089 domain-containing protein [Candidatus Bathyarchaeia archaeon]
MSTGLTPEELGRYVDRAAALCDLRIAPAHRPGVIQSLGGLAQAAALVAEFAIPEETEPAPVFEPAPGAEPA